MMITATGSPAHAARYPPVTNGELAAWNQTTDQKRHRCRHHDARDVGSEQQQCTKGIGIQPELEADAYNGKRRDKGDRDRNAG